MKINIKKLVSYLLSVVFLSILIVSSQQVEASRFSNIIQTSASQKSEEESNNFNFIKSNEKVKDFLYDGSVLLYGGILLITVSCLGIFFTFKPKRKKKQKKDLNKTKK